MADVDARILVASRLDLQHNRHFASAPLDAAVENYFALYSQLPVLYGARLDRPSHPCQHQMLTLTGAT